MVENIRFHPKFFKKMTFRKWIFSTIFWYDTKLSQVRQQGVAFYTSLRNCDSLLSHLLRQSDAHFDTLHKTRLLVLPA